MQMKRRMEPEDSVALAEGSNKRKMPLGGRLGPPRSSHPPASIGPQQNCSLELRKIPRGLNAISHLNNHFSKFGKIVNIQISYEGDPEAAIVTFSTHAEANVAYRSTEAVLNNRFIKVFWHTPPSNDQPIGGSTKIENPMSLRRSYPNQYSINNMKTDVSAATTPVTPSTSSDAVTGSSTAATPTTTTVNTGAKLVKTPTTGITAAGQPVTSPSTAMRLKNQKINRAATQMLRKKQEEKSKEAVQIAHGLQKRKTDIMDGLFNELHQLMALYEKPENSEACRSELKSMMSGIEKKIETLKNEIEQGTGQINAQMQNQPPVRKTKEQTQKEMLDVELDLISQEQHVSFFDFQS
jgi:RNA-binding protein 26